MQNYKPQYRELFELIKTLPNKEAECVFQKIRTGTDAITILNHIKVGNILLEMAKNCKNEKPFYCRIENILTKL